MAKKSTKKPETAPTLETVLICLGAIIILYGISAVTNKEVPIVIYAIIAGILFGVGNVRKLLGGGDDR
jgi:hypothetical protein